MSKQQYHTWLEVAFEHGYFPNGELPMKRLVPAASTRQLLERQGMLFRAVNTGFAVLVDQRFEQDAALFYEHAGVISLNFLFDPLDPYFLNFTELKSKQASRHVFAPKSGKQSDPIELVLQDAADAAFSEPAFGMVSLPLSLLKKSGTGLKFCLHFNVLQAQWRYVVVNRNGLDLNQPAITDNAGFFFQEPKPVKLSNGQSALSFDSGKEDFPFRQRAEKHFQLKRHVDREKNTEGFANGEVLIAHLPNPSVQQLGIERKGKKSRYYSEIYVYL